MVGTSRPSRSQSSRPMSTPTRPAMAMRWTTALVEPPIAPLTRMAFSKASRVSTLESRRSSAAMATMRRPTAWARTLRRESTAGIAALVGSAMPSASTIEAIVEAVPMVMQCPAERDWPASASMKSSTLISPLFTCSESCQTAVPEPMSRPRYLPFSIGPPEITMVGRSTLAAPITSDGVVLSQPQSSTTASIGLARIDSSTSIEARFLRNIAVGRRFDSPSEVTGNSSGKPPASSTPRRTCSAITRKCALQGVSSDQVLQMPMTGRPSNMCDGMAWFRIQLRWTKPSLSFFPNHSAER